MSPRNKFWKNWLRNCYLIVTKKMADLSKERKSNTETKFSLKAIKTFCEKLALANLNLIKSRIFIFIYLFFKVEFLK